MKPVANAEEGHQPLIDRRHLWARQLPEHAPDPPLIDGSQMIDQREGLPGESALARRQRRIEESLARSPRDRYHAQERKALVANDIWIAHHNAGPHAMLFVTERGVELHYDNRAAEELHSRSSTQPSPGTHRTALPTLLSTSASVSSSGKLRVHASSPSSANSTLSGCGLCRDRRSSSRRRRSSSCRTASATSLLRFFSRRSMSRTRSIGRVTVTRPKSAISYSQYDHTNSAAVTWDEVSTRRCSTCRHRS